MAKMTVAQLQEGLTFVQTKVEDLETELKELTVEVNSLISSVEMRMGGLTSQTISTTGKLNTAIEGLKEELKYYKSKVEYSLGYFSKVTDILLFFVVIDTVVLVYQYFR